MSNSLSKIVFQNKNSLRFAFYILCSLLRYTLADGTMRKEEGYFKDDGETQIFVKVGSYSYIGSDGITYSVEYTADENGYVASVSP